MILILSLTLTILFGTGYWYYFAHLTPTEQTIGTNPFTSTTSTGVPITEPATEITALDGTKYRIPDPTLGKKSDMLDSGTYYQLTDNQETQGDNAQFEIIYGTDSSIKIGLVKEPLKDSRLAAEVVLRKLFPLSDQELCKLDVFVSVPAMVNETFAGNNLGLSFCVGAMKLP